MELNYIELSDEQWDAYLSVALAETFSKPGAADVSPEDKKKLKGILAHYAKMAHPFTACKRDQMKHGLSEEHADRRCAVIKDIIRGTTKWRGKADAVLEPEIVLDAAALTELLEAEAVDLASWSEHLHPRDANGRFVASAHEMLRSTYVETESPSGYTPPHSVRYIPKSQLRDIKKHLPKEQAALIDRELSNPERDESKTNPLKLESRPPAAGGRNLLAERLDTEAFLASQPNAGPLDSRVKSLLRDTPPATAKRLWKRWASGKADTREIRRAARDLARPFSLTRQIADLAGLKKREGDDVNVSNDAGLRANTGTTTTTGATATAGSGANASYTISTATTNDGTSAQGDDWQQEQIRLGSDTAELDLALKVGDVVEWGNDGEADAKGYGLVTEVDTTNQQVRVVPLEPGPNGALSKSGEDAVMKDIDNVNASSKRLTESVAWPKKAQENAVLGMWMARDHGETVPGVALDLADGKVLDEEQIDEVADFFLSVCSDDDPTFDCSWAEYQMYGGDAGREWIAQLSEISEAIEAASGIASESKNDFYTGSGKFSPGDKVQWKGGDGKTVTGTIVRVLKKDGTPMCLVRTSDGGTVTVSHSSLSRATSGSSGSSDNEGEGDLASTYQIAAAQMPVDMSEVIDLGGNVWKKHILPYGKIHYKGRTLDFSKDFARKLVENFKRKPFDSVPFINVDADNRHNSDPERVRGEVTNLELGEDGIYARVETNEKGTEYLKTVNPKLGSSVRVRFDWKRPADNKYFGPVLEHLAGTTLPHVPGLKPFAPADLSLVEMSEQPSMLRHAPGAGGVEDLTACSFIALEPDSGESEEGGDPVTPQDKPDNTKEVTNLTDANANSNASETEGGKTNPLDQIDLSQFPEEQRYAVAALVEAAQEREHEAKKAYDFAEQAMTAMKKQKQELHNERVKSYVSDLADTGMVPAVLKPIEALLSDQSLAGKEMTVDLSDDGSGAQTTDVHGLVKMIADNYPREMEYGEKGRTDLAEEDDDAAFEAMWEKYQQDHGIGLGAPKGGE